MKYEDIARAVEGIPFISPENGRTLYDSILEHGHRDLLELGFAHGVGTCYMAAALDELGEGKIHSVDLESSREWQTPSIEELLAKAGLEKYVEIHREKSGYNWWLYKAIRDGTVDGQCRERFDFCIIDGPKNWTVDGCAFFLVEKLLRPNGWIVFDDYAWNYAAFDREATDGIQHNDLAPDERETPHIKQVFNYLVMQHPNFAEFIIHSDGDWAWAKKSKGEARKITLEYQESYRDIVSLLFRKVKKLLGRNKLAFDKDELLKK